VIEAREKRGLQPGLLQLKYKLSKDPVCHLTSVSRKIASGDQHKIIYSLGNKFPLNHSTHIHEKKRKWLHLLPLVDFVLNDYIVQCSTV